MNQLLAACRPPLLPWFSAALQDFPTDIRAVPTCVGCNARCARGRSVDTLTWGLDLMMQQMNH